MSDENTISLKEYIKDILAEKDKSALAAITAVKEANQILEVNSQRWREASNEWRSAMTDRERTFLNKTEFLDYKESVEKALKVEKERADKAEGAGIGKEQSMTKFIGWILFVITILGFVFTHIAFK